LWAVAERLGENRDRRGLCQFIEGVSSVVCCGEFHSIQICDGTSPNCFSQNGTHPYRLSLTYEQNIEIALLYERKVDNAIGVRRER
jgi:hypothetical protein